jgi:protein-disulfide isomerase/uncharacterized membrane protein
LEETDMYKTLTLNGYGRRFLSFLAGAGMMAASIMTMRHFFLANYPASIYEGAFCDVSAFFNCDSSAFSVISQVLGIPIGYFGLFAGALVVLGSLFPSEAFERTNKSIALANVLGVLALFAYSVFFLKSLCLLCSGYYVFSILSFLLFWRYGIDREAHGFFSRYARFSLKLVLVFAVVAAMGAYGVILFHNAKKEAQTGTAQTIVRQFFELPKVAWPSVISPFWTAKSTEKFEDAPIQVVEYIDFLCPDCLYLTQQMDKLKKEFAGKINVAFQYFPLETQCNKVVTRNLHPGACDLSLMSAYDPAKFLAIHDEIFANFRTAKASPEWRQALARKYGVEAALTDEKTKALVESIINTGMEFEKNSEKAAYGIRSTPTTIINNRMLIGTLPYNHLRAIFQALVDEKEGGRKYLENWVPVPKKTLQTVK